MSPTCYLFRFIQHSLGVTETKSFNLPFWCHFIVWSKIILWHDWNADFCFNSHFILLDLLNSWNHNVFISTWDHKDSTYIYSKSMDLVLVSVQFSLSVVSDSLWPHEPQHARPPCRSPTPGVHPNPWSKKKEMKQAHIDNNIYIWHFCLRHLMYWCLVFIYLLKGNISLVE